MLASRLRDWWACSTQTEDMRSVCVMLVAMLFAVALLPGTDAAEGIFSYDNQSAWAGSCTTGRRQSPIIIATINAVSSNDLESLDMVQWDVPVSGSFENTGSTVQFTPNTPSATVTNHRGLYTVQQFHFHWGENNTLGSEHKVDSIAYAAEAHFVTQKNTGNETASDYYSVIAVLFEADDSATETGFWAKLVPPTEDDAISIITDITFSDLLPVNLDYYYYEGSLTTPPCSEFVQWFVLKTPIKIPSSYLQKLRQIEDNFNGTLTRDYRNTQPINDRSILLYTSGGTGVAPGCGVVPMLAAAMLCLLFAQFNN